MSGIQNLDARLRAAGSDIIDSAEKAKVAANQVASQFNSSGKISVGGVASAVEGSIAELKGATLDMANTTNGITGPSFGSLDLAQGGISQVLQSKLPNLQLQKYSENHLVEQRKIDGCV